MKKLPTRVLKLGGSLLSLPDIGWRTRSWLASQEPAENRIIAGGGEIVEAVRDLATVHPLPDDYWHWLCIDLLQSTFSLACRLFPDADAVETTDQFLRLFDLGRDAKQNCAIVNPAAFYTKTNHRSLPLMLPESWDTTSDSIAALLARMLNAEELVLLKSCGPLEADYPPASESSRDPLDPVVDAYFDQAIEFIPRVRLVNLRADT